MFSGGIQTLSLMAFMGTESQFFLLPKNADTGICSELLQRSRYIEHIVHLFTLKMFTADLI
jgi:hypothetical protein